MAKETDKKPLSLQQKLDAIAFKNNQIKMVSDLQSENARLKDMMASKRSRRGSAPRIQGLQTLKNTLGKQFIKE